MLASAFGCFIFGPDFLLFCLLCSVLPLGLLFDVFLCLSLGHTCLYLSPEHICLMKMLPVINVTKEQLHVSKLSSAVE